MRKHLGRRAAAAVLAAGLLGAGAGAAAAEVSVRVYFDGELATPTDVNGEPVEVFARDGTTYLPLRAIAGYLGIPIEWDPETGAVYVGTIPGRTVKTKTGTYVGRLDPETGVVAYKGVTFGTAERWKRAELPAESDEVHYPAESVLPVQGTYDPETQSEDVLQMDIYVNPAGTSDKKAVIVWCPVGGGTASRGGSTDPSKIVAEEPDVIVAVPNSRVSYFGCINLTEFDDYAEYEDEYRYSNNLIRTDFLLALQWIGENVAAFGGDPENVTIGGQSAGAVTASSMLLIPGATEYFDKVIMESGVAIDRISLATWEESLEAAEKFREHTGVTTIAEALELEPQELLDAQAYLSSGAIGAYLPDSQSKMFTTVIDNVVVFDDYWEQLEEVDASNDVEILVGSTNGEYDRDLAGLSEEEALAAIISANWGKLDPARGGAEDADEIIGSYVERKEQYGRDTITAYKDLKNDINQKVSAVMIAELFSRGGNAYLFSYEWYAENADGLRAVHGSDRNALFGTDENAPEELQKAMRRAWSCFALTGDPNAGNAYFEDAGVEWAPYDAEGKCTMVFDTDLHTEAGQRVEDIETLMPLFGEYEALRG